MADIEAGLLQAPLSIVPAAIIYYKLSAELGERIARLEERYNSLKERVDRMGECIACMAAADPETMGDKRKRPSRIDLVISSIAVGMVVFNVYAAIVAAYLALTASQPIYLVLAAIFSLEAILANVASNRANKGKRLSALTYLAASTVAYIALLVLAH